MASSAQKPHHHHHRLPTQHGTTAAPPPTPSAQPNLSSNATTSDALFHLLHRLPPTLSLSLPARRSSSSSSSITTPPLISLSDPKQSLGSALLSAATELGFFHLRHHPIPPDLAVAAESAAVSLFNLPIHQKQLLFPNNWPLGYDSLDNEDDEGSSACEFCLDPSSTDPETDSGLDLGPLCEFGREMEKLGLEAMEELASAVGFGNPARDDPSKLCSMMWISDGDNNPGRIYPYVVGLHYQAKCQRYTLSSDSGWVNVSGRVDSLLVTLGDIAQVWSNGKCKKVRGRPMPSTIHDDNNNNNNNNNNNSSKCITISLLITLPLETMVSPLIPNLSLEEHEESVDPTQEQRVFQSFSFEDYAWRIYHERLPLKDPLLRYRIR